MAPLPGTGLAYRIPDPEESQIDSLDCGPSDAGKEEQEYFTRRGWTGLADGREAQCFELRTGENAVVGYVALGIVQKPFPEPKSRGKADFIFLYHLALARRFQGQSDETAEFPVKWSIRALQLVDFIAHEQECVGVYLNVREDNTPAIQRYEKYGFSQDGSYERKDGTEMRRYRRVIGA